MILVGENEKKVNTSQPPLLVFFSPSKSILPNITNDCQCAFISGTLITDNSLLVFETLHYIIMKRKSNNGYVGIRLDIAKAYDSLEWDFIEKL